MKIRRFFSIAGALCALLILHSCSSSTPPSNTSGNSTSVKPKAGSTYTDSTSKKDTSLTNQAGTEVNFTLVDTNRTVGGKSGVYVFVSSAVDPATGTVDSVFQYYEANGDLSIYVPFGAGGFTVGSEWVTFPFASQSTSNITTLKTFVLIDSVTLTGTVQGSGTGTQTINGNSLYVEKATLNSTAYSADTIPATVELTYAPSIGLVTYQDITAHGMISFLHANITGGNTSFLLKYSLN
jgi:hypothetical protein